MKLRHVYERLGSLRISRENLVPVPRRRGERLALGLGLFGAALGAAEVVAPRTVAKLVGVADSTAQRATLRAAGLRELSSAAGIFTSERPAGWLWSRVAGDVLDLGMLARAFGSSEARRERVAVAAAALLGVTLLDLLCAQQLEGEAVSDNSLALDQVLASDAQVAERWP
jgi:hypothetical protein